jgi:hypothetical protein
MGTHLAAGGTEASLTAGQPLAALLALGGAIKTDHDGVSFISMIGYWYPISLESSYRNLDTSNH